MSQPAASSLIRHLEADLGTELFSRTARGMIAMPLGSIARRLLDETFEVATGQRSRGLPAISPAYGRARISYFREQRRGVTVIWKSCASTQGPEVHVEERGSGEAAYG